jgi:DNA-binding transcriptional LysR family regulator
MTDSQLQALVALADSGSFTAAAKQLRTSQSAVSHAIAGLEQALRVALVRRTARGVQLTEIGEATARQAREVLRLKARIRQEADAARRLQRGSLRVGSFGVSASRVLLPPMLEAFAQRHPDIEVLVSEGTDDEVEQWVRDGTVEIGFVTLPNDDLDTLPIAEDEMLVVLPTAHPLAGAPCIAARALDGAPFIMSTGGCEPLIRGATSEVTLDVRHHIRESDTILAMVGRGMGISMKPRLSLPDAPPPGVAFVPLDPPRLRQVALAVRRRDDASHATLAVLKVAAAHAPGSARPRLLVTAPRRRASS